MSLVQGFQRWQLFKRQARGPLQLSSPEARPLQLRFTEVRPRKSVFSRFRGCFSPHP